MREAYDIMGAKPKYNVVGFMPVEAVRKVRPDPNDPAVHSLDVVWERAMIGLGQTRVPDTRPGSKGHCGIEGLDQQGKDASGQGLKIYRKSLKRKLAALANETPGSGPWKADQGRSAD